MALSARAQIVIINAKVFELQRKAAELEVLARNEVDTPSIVSGTVITATYGRGDKAKDVTATVTGVKREEGKAALFKVLIGEGFDAEVGIIFESAIKSIVSQPAPQEGEQGAVAADPLSQDTAAA